MSFLRFFDDNDDAIFEPGSLITFPMFTWSNQGGLSCPAGGVRGVRALVFEFSSQSSMLLYLCYVIDRHNTH